MSCRAQGLPAWCAHIGMLTPHVPHGVQEVARLFEQYGRVERIDMKTGEDRVHGGTPPARALPP